jgi:hypothetical protein
MQTTDDDPNELFRSLHDHHELWVSDGTDAGTTKSTGVSVAAWTVSV